MAVSPNYTYNFTDANASNYLPCKPISLLDPYKRLIATSAVIVGVAATLIGGPLFYIGLALMTGPGLFYGKNLYLENIPEFGRMVIAGVRSGLGSQSTDNGFDDWHTAGSSWSNLPARSLAVAIRDFLDQHQINKSTYANFDLAGNGFYSDAVGNGATDHDFSRASAQKISAMTIDGMEKYEDKYQFVSSIENLAKTRRQSDLAENLGKTVTEPGYLLVSSAHEGQAGPNRKNGQKTATEVAELFKGFTLNQQLTNQFRRASLDSVYGLWLARNIIVLEKKSAE